MKYVSPYYHLDHATHPMSPLLYNVKEMYIRKVLYTDPPPITPGYTVWLNKTTNNWQCSYHECSSKEEAMQMLDDILLKEGYIFLDEERWQKLSILL